MVIQIKYRPEVVETTSTISINNGGSTNEKGCLLKENSSVLLSDGRSVTIPKSFTVHSGGVIGYCEYAHRTYISDLDDISFRDRKEYTIKLNVQTPLLPKFVPEFVIRALTKVSLIPYFKCDCWAGTDPKTVLVYTKEKFEEYEKQKEEHKKFIMRLLPDGKYAELTVLCPYYHYCISQFPKKTFVSNDGEEYTEMEMDMIKIKRMCE